MSLKSTLISSPTNSNSNSNNTISTTLQDKILASVLLFCILPFLLIDIYFAITSANCSTNNLSNYAFDIEIYLVIDIIGLYLLFTFAMFTIFLQNIFTFLSRRSKLLIEIVYIIYSTVLFINGTIMYLHYIDLTNKDQIVSCSSNVYTYCFINSLVKLFSLFLYCYKKYSEIQRAKKKASIILEFEGSFSASPYTVTDSINVSINSENSDNNV